MIGIWLLLLVALLQGSGDGAATVGELFESGRSWQQFLTGVSAQRELWLKTESAVTIPIDIIDRARKDDSRSETAGTSRTAARGAAIGVGGDVTFYGVPTLLRNTHDDHPVSFQLFFRVAPANTARRM
jgi:hypothetical protein